MAKNNEVGNPAKIKDLNDAIVLLNGQAVMHPKKRLAADPCAEVEKVREHFRRRAVAVCESDRTGARDYYFDER